jgi:hypothetical protein
MSNNKYDSLLLPSLVGDFKRRIFSSLCCSCLAIVGDLTPQDTELEVIKIEMYSAIIKLHQELSSLEDLDGKST